jgi:uncharacterized membrane protein required for colicin V production
MHFNLLDYLILGILLVSALVGLRKGLIDALGRITGILAAIVIAVLYYDNCICYLEQQYGLTSLLSDYIREKAPVTAFSTNNGVIGLFNSSQDFVDTANQLAYLIILIGVFLLSLIIISWFIRLIFSLLNKLFSWGPLGGINKILGMLLIVGKNLVIIAIIAGIIHPAIQTAAQIGWDGAIIANKYMQESYLFGDILNIFNICKDLLGMNR